MKNNSNQAISPFITISFVLLALAVMIGAFGAHGLEKMNLEPKFLKTFHTGVRYHFYHAFSLLCISIIHLIRPFKAKMSQFSYILGIILFSGNCYMYTITQNKVFAMIVPIGGVCFIIGHFLSAWSLYASSKN